MGGSNSTDSLVTLTNWSGNVTRTPSAYFEPSTLKELATIVTSAPKVRVCGSGMSPNGIGITADEGTAVVNMRHFNKIIKVDPASKRIIAESGVLLEELLDALEVEGLSLFNQPCIKGMTLGGLIQAGCHGTGAALPTVDETVVSLKLMRPDGEVIEVTEADGDLFQAAKSGLGAFGPVLEVTLALDDLYFLSGEVKVLPTTALAAGHRQRLSQYDRVTYHHMPGTGKTIVRTYKRHTSLAAARGEAASNNTRVKKFTPEEKVSELIELLYKVSSPACGLSQSEFAHLHSTKSFTQLRQEIMLKSDPLDPEVIRQINRAETAFWEKSQEADAGVGPRILMFDCGFKQHVREFVLEAGDDGGLGDRDLRFVTELLDLIQRTDIAAPAPIEQRYSAAGSALLSPVYKAGGEKGVFTWVGIIKYLVGEADTDERITAAMREYYRAVLDALEAKYGLTEHLAKADLQADNLESMCRRYNRRKVEYKRFEAARMAHDPEGKFLSQHVEGVTRDPERFRQQIVAAKMEE